MPQPKTLTPSKQIGPAPAEAALAKLREENALLKSRLEEARDTIAGYRKKLDTHSTATYRHARLMRLLEALGVPLPESDDEYVSSTYLARAKKAIATCDEVREAEAQRDVVIKALKHLLGAKEVEISKKVGEEEGHHINFLLRNDELDREMAFRICWDHEKIEYNRISVRLPGATLPQFADEECIVFDFPQGPFFLAEVLCAVHEVQIGDDAS